MLHHYIVECQFEDSDKIHKITLSTKTQMSQEDVLDWAKDAAFSRGFDRIIKIIEEVTTVNIITDTVIELSTRMDV